MLTKQEQYWGVIILAGIFILFYTHHLNSNTLAYNMRIRRALFATDDTWKENPLLKNLVTPNWMFTALPITYHRVRDIITTLPAVNIHEQSSIKGAVFNIRFKPNRCWWIELTSGLEKEVACFKGSQNFCVSRTGLDDIVLTSGFNFFASPNIQLAIYGLAGFPTKRDVTALEAFDTPVGTRFYNIGIGSEVSYAFSNSLEKSIVGIFQARCIHFFNRNWYPILPINNTIQPGNITDLLLTLQYRKKIDLFEIGYNATFFTNQAVITPATIRRSNNFLRNSFYATYNHLIFTPSLINCPLIIGFGANFSWSKQFNTQIGIAWLSFTTLF